MPVHSFGSPESFADARLSVLLKGHSGSGKTRTALSFPGPIRLLYTDKNRETVRQMVTAGTQVEGSIIETWSQFSNEVLPGLLRRESTCQTITLDTVDFLSAMMWTDIEGSKGKLSMQDFGTGLRRLSEATRSLVSLTLPQDQHPGYHVVFCCHLKDVTDDSGSLLRIGPAIMGQFANQLEDYFDYVLLLQGQMISQIQQVNGQSKSVPAKQFKIWSVPPDRYHTCKGGVLPAELTIDQDQNAFEVLNQFWKV